GRPRAIPWSSFGARDGAYRLSQTVWEDLNFFTQSHSHQRLLLDQCLPNPM
ncbi:MAG: hypothetical protein, partial [Olavius algarvensis Delta 4 endosymbiont]